MDFITKLLLSGNYNTILTITNIDCSKTSIFLPCKETIDSKGVAQLYLTHILPHYSLPKKIILDQDPHFTSCFGKELCHLLDICQNISTTYHPQTDGASECTNQSLEQYLCMFCCVYFVVFWCWGVALALILWQNDAPQPLSLFSQVIA